MTPRLVHAALASALLLAAAGLIACAPAAALPDLDPATRTFRHQAPGAHAVALVGDFNDWAVGQTPLSGPDAEGWWTVSVSLEPGRHGYMFVVDGETFVRPASAPMFQADGFGGEIAVLYVMPREQRVQ